MYDVLTIGSSLVDVFIHSDNFKLQPSSEGTMLCQLYGAKVEVDKFELQTGGGGGNTAVGFARLGFRTGVVSETGKDTLSDLVIKDFQKEFVMTNFVVRERKEDTGGAVLMVGPTGDRTVMVHRGAASMLNPHDMPEAELQRAGWVHLSSISGRHNTLEHIFHILRRSGKNNQFGTERKLSWNPGKKELFLLAENRLPVNQIPAEILIMNKQEWQICETVHSTLRLHIPWIVITAGSEGGVVMVKDEGEFKFKSSAVKAVEATGAGDSFAVGVVAGKIWGLSPQESVRLGVINAESVVAQVGAKPGLLTKPALKQAAGVS